MKRLISTTLEEITTTSESCITVADTVDLSRPLPAVAAQLSPVNGTQSPVFPGSYRTLDSTITDCYSFLERHPVDRLRPSSLPEVPEEAARLVIDGALRLVEPRNIGNILLRNFEDEYDVTVSMEEQFPAVMDSYARFIGRIPSLGEELRHASYERLQPFVQSVELYHFSITSNHPSLLSFFELSGLLESGSGKRELSEPRSSAAQQLASPHLSSYHSLFRTARGFRA